LIQILYLPGRGITLLALSLIEPTGQSHPQKRGPKRNADARITTINPVLTDDAIRLEYLPPKIQSIGIL
jgi:hypothetical protein